MEVKVNVEVKDIMKLLSNIQKYCVDNIGCKGCPFYLGDDGDCSQCQLKRLFLELGYYPTGWDLEEIECLLKR